MAKAALLIGVSEYGAGLNQLPKAVEDIEAMKVTLQQPDLGGFAEVKVLPNPDTMMMQLEIERLFADRTRDDLVLLFFSGHGVKDDRGNLYFATSITRKNAEGELLKSTAVPATFVHDIMSNSRSRRQVIILDCCFSGAFAKGLAAKDDGMVNIKEQLGGEGRVVLTSSASTQYSFESTGADLSIYTRYLVEGIRSGAADEDSDGFVSVEELHAYAKRKVHEASPAMKPKIYAVEEGFRILLSKSPKGDPTLIYRKEVEHLTSRGKISKIGRRILNKLQENLGISAEVASEIEAEVSKPHQEYKEKLQTYQQALTEATQREFPLSDYTWEELNRYQQILGLRDTDIAPIKTAILNERVTAQPVKPPLVTATTPERPKTEPNPEAAASIAQPQTDVRSNTTAPTPAVVSAVNLDKSQTPPLQHLRLSLIVISVGILAGLGGFWGVNVLRGNSSHPLPPDFPDSGSTIPIPQPKPNQALQNRREALGIDKRFFTQLVDASFYAEYPEWDGRTLSDAPEDAIWRDRWNAIADAWLNTLDAHLSATARSQLGSYTTQNTTERSREVGQQYHLSSRALNDMADAKFFQLFPAPNQSFMDDHSKFTNTNMGQIWHGIATDELQKVREGNTLKELVFNGSDSLQATGSLAAGEGQAYIFQLTQGQQLNVDVDVPYRAAQISVYPPNLRKEPAFLEDSTETQVIKSLPQDGYYEVVIVSISETPFNYTLSLSVQ